MLASFLVCAKRLDEPALALRDKNRLPVFATKRQISRFFAFQRNLLLNRSVWFHDGNRTLLDSSYKQPSGDICAETVDRVGLTLTKQNAPRAEIVDLNEAIVEVIALTYSEAVKTGVTVSTRLAPQLPRVQGDRVQLQQVMLNLIVNAIQAMSGIGEGARELQISIDAVPSEGGVRVGVRDTGPGLSPESLPRLFEPFYTTKPEGMGLSVCRSIIKAHRDGCGRSRANRRVLSFSLRSLPPKRTDRNRVDVALWHFRTWGHDRFESVTRTKTDVVRFQVYGFTP